MSDTIQEPIDVVIETELDLREKIMDMLNLLGLYELNAVRFIVERGLIGQFRYGRFDPHKEHRNMDEEIVAEYSDVMWYREFKRIMREVGR